MFNIPLQSHSRAIHKMLTARTDVRPRVELMGTSGKHQLKVTKGRERDVRSTRKMQDPRGWKLIQ